MVTSPWTVGVGVDIDAQFSPALLPPPKEFFGRTPIALAVMTSAPGTGHICRVFFDRATFYVARTEGLIPMAVTTIAGKAIEVDDDGCLIRAADWDEDVARGIAAAEGIGQLTEEHWRVIRYVRQRYVSGEHPPTCRAVSRATGLTPRRLFQLFPKQPVHLAAKIGGAPEPHDYIGGCGVNWWSRWR